MAKILKLTLLNHLFYYTEITGGGASTTLTGGFIGDLALTYAFANALRPMEIKHRTQPDYGEIRDFGFYCTVARPLSRLTQTDIYTQNTLFTDGYPDLDSIDKSGKSPYKNYRQTQGFAIGSEFVALWLGSDEQLPSVVRVGRAKETLVKIEEIAPPQYADFKKVYGDNFWLNAFSLQTIFDNTSTAVKILSRTPKARLQFVVEQYNLMQHLSLTDVQEIFEPIFKN